MTVGILARPIDVEAVVSVLDQRNTQAALYKPRNDLLDQRRLAAAGPAGETEDAHPGAWVNRLQPAAEHRYRHRDESEHHIDQDEASNARHGRACVRPGLRRDGALQAAIGNNAEVNE